MWGRRPGFGEWLAGKHRELAGPANDCTSRDPWTGAACAKSRGHYGEHGGIASDGQWRNW